MTTCPHCGCAQNDNSSNSEGMISIEVPEHHYPLFRKMMFEMNTRFGMHGFGELANELKSYHDLFMGDFEIMRYCNDASLAMVMIGIKRQIPASVCIDPYPDAKQFKLAVRFHMGGEKVKSLTVVENNSYDRVTKIRDYLVDYISRAGISFDPGEI